MKPSRTVFDGRTFDVGPTTVRGVSPAAQLLGALLGCLLVFGVFRGADAQENWTRFRGPDGTGIADAPSIPAAFDEKNYRWQTALPGSGHSSPVLWGDKIFLTCRIEEQDERLVVCLDASEGKILWTWKDAFESYRAHRFNSPAASTPAVDAKHVYVTWISGETFTLLALDHDGKEVWRRSMPNFKTSFGPGTSPIVLDGVVIAGNNHPGETAFVIGLDARTGETRWKVSRTSGYASYGTPAVRRLADGTREVVFASPAHGITGIDPATGKVNWELDGLFTLKTVASPVLAGGLVFASGGRGGGGQESAAVRPGVAASGSKPELVYQLDSGLPYVPTPIAVAGYLFLWSDGGVVTCIEPETGKQIWQERVGGAYFASPVCVNGRIYGVSKEGQVVVIEAGPQYKLLATNQLPEGSYATPAVAGGRMYFRTFKQLICVEGKPQ